MDSSLKKQKSESSAQKREGQNNNRDSSLSAPADNDTYNHAFLAKMMHSMDELVMDPMWDFSTEKHQPVLVQGDSLVIRPLTADDVGFMSGFVCSIL